MKKIVTVLIFCVALLAACTQSEGGFTIAKNGTITAYKGTVKELEIPARISGVKVTAIGNNAFREKELEKVIIPVGVTSIGDYAFYVNKLENISIPDGVISIGAYAFSGNRVYSATIPGSVKSISKEAFSYAGLSYVTLSAGIMTIDVSAFANNQLRSVTIPGSVTSIGEGAFSYNWLKSAIIPDGITFISDNAFFHNSLESVIIPDSVTSIGTSAFNHNKLSSVVIPNGVTSIGDLAFSENQLTSVTIPAGVTVIGTKVFSDNKLISVTIPDGVTRISDNAFYGNQLATVTIPGSVTTIGKEAFANNQLASVAIPVGVTNIGINAFANNQLVSVTIPDGVAGIGKEAFANNQLKSVSIPADVFYVSSTAFKNNPLATLTIGGGVSLSNEERISDSLKTLVLGADIRFNRISFGSSVYYEYLYNGKRAGTYLVRSSDDTGREGDFEYVITKYGAVIVQYHGDIRSVQAIPQQLGGMAVIGIGGMFARKTAHRLQLPDGVTFLDKKIYEENQTIRTLRGKSIFNNEKPDEDDDVDSHELKLIGWSHTDLLAYLQDDWYSPDASISLVIIDTADNKIMESIKIRLGHEEEAIDYDFSPSARIRVGLRNWNDALARYNFTERINQLQNGFSRLESSPFPYVQDNVSYDCWLEAVVEQLIDEYSWESPIIVKWNLMASNGSRTEIIAGGVEESRGGQGHEGGYAGSRVIGYFETPVKNRLLAAIAHYVDGNMYREIQVYGLHLNF
jgi:hypothetical protein